MVLSFTYGYRMVTWFSVKSISTELKAAEAEILKIAKEDFSNPPIKDVFLGVTFGRFDFVVDFYCKSGKVASYYVSSIADKLEEIGIKTSFSNVMCKLIGKTTEGNIRRESPLRCYVYLRPSTDIELTYRMFEENCKQIAFSPSSSLMLWNCSAYPLILTVSGNTASEILDVARKTVQALQQHLEESSTFLALRLGAADLAGKELIALCFIKLGKFPCDLKIPPPYSGGLWSQERFGSALECLGWYDTCVSYTANSLVDIQERVFSLREKNEKCIRYTSTTLLYPHQDETDGRTKDT
jgi:hypothetical protein